MHKKRFKIITSILWIITFILIVLSCKPLIRIFKKETHFNYDYVSTISIHYNGENNITVWNRDYVNQILEYLNSLELIEEEIPYHEQALYHGDWEEYENKLREIGYYTIFISDDMICFSTNYAFVIPDGYCECDTRCVSYYIKNSGFDPENKTSNFYNSLREITDKADKYEDSSSQKINIF